MLTIFDGSNGYPISQDDYYIRELASGYDEVIFNVNIRDPIYQYVKEEAVIRDRDENIYLIKQIDAGNETAKVVAQINLDDWKSQIYLDYSNNSATISQTVQSVLPSGWVLIDSSGVTKRRTIPTSDTTTDYNVTALAVLEDCVSVYGVRFRFNTALKRVTIINPDNYSSAGAFATRDLNLRALNYKGKSDSLITRLYAEGADGLTFASINDGKAYVDNQSYVNKVICGYWKDERYTDAQSLLDDATEKLKELSRPAQSYDCDVLDLANTNPEMYGFEDFSLFEVVTLIDDAKESRADYQVVERWTYPYYPVKNKIILAATTPNIQTTVQNVISSINSSTSGFQQMMQAAIDNATALITGNKGGYVVFHDSDDDGYPDEILIMNTPDISTATKVWRWNNSGLGYSGHGYNPPSPYGYGLAMTIDGSIVANFITTGQLNAGLIKVGRIEDLQNKNYWDMTTGEFRLSTGAQIGGSDIASVDEVDDAIDDYDTNYLNQTRVFNKLTNNGALQGIYMSNGELYINGTYIKAGTIDATLIKAGIIKDTQNKNYWNMATGEFRLAATTTVGSANNAVASASSVADAISDYDSDLDQEEIFNRLTDDGTTMGIYLDSRDNKLYINATYIATGTITGHNSGFSLNMDTGAFTLSNGTITGVSVQSAAAGEAGAYNARLVLDNTTSIKGYYGDTMHNLINLEQVVSGSHQMTIDADTQLNIRTPHVYVTTQSAGTGTATVYETITQTSQTMSSDPTYYSVKNLGKIEAGDPDAPSEVKEIYVAHVEEEDAGPDDVYCTLPVYLKYDETPLKYMHGMLIGESTSESVII